MEWKEILLAILAIAEIIVRLTPTEKDNSILNKIMWVVNKLIPNKIKKIMNNRFRLKPHEIEALMKM